MVRILMAAAVVGLLACSGSSTERASAGGESDGPPDGAGTAGDDFAPGAGSCVVDEDCEAVASSCCECPTFALPVAEGVGQVCEDVACEQPSTCSAVEAICGDEGSCVLACSPVVCDLSCSDGFVIDEGGCATCACADPGAAMGCEQNEDCLQVAADCCGCARGGQDTAVLAAEASGFVDGLGCTGSEVCPEVDACDPDVVPTCEFGQCLLVSPVLMDPGEVPAVCGAPDAPTCPEGSVCVLNPRDYPMVAAAGLGACLPPE